MISSDMHVRALFQQALAVAAARDAQRAIMLFRQVLQKDPAFMPAYVELGLLLADRGELGEAEANLLRAAELAPSDVNCAWALADFYRRQGEWPHARRWFERAIELAPRHMALRKGLLHVLQALDDHAAMLREAEQILGAEPGNAAVVVIRARALEAMGRATEALAQLENVLERDGSTALLAQWARLMLYVERNEELLDRLKCEVDRNPGNAEVLHVLSSVYIEIGRYAEAEMALQAEHALRPDDVRVMYDLGVVCRTLGRLQSANQWLERLLAIDAGHAAAWRLLGEGRKYAADDPAFHQLQVVASGAEARSLEDRAQLHYALGKANDDVGDVAASFRHYVEGGKLRRMQFESESDALAPRLLRVDAWRKTIASAEAGFSSELPVFVLGMPRSGTTLIEQILASHPKVFGAGELTYLERCLDGLKVGGERVDTGTRVPFFGEDSAAGDVERGKRYVQEISKLASGETLRIVDKLPGNFIWAGLIPAILPQARIIHCRRHPAEICLSAFKTYFTDGHLYSYDLADLGRYYRRYEQIMAIWRDSLPADRFIEVKYEDVVRDYENQARNLIRFIGMEWDDACLHFHANDRPVSTASAAQVRQPLYATSINRWRRYEQYLGPLLDEIGDLIAQYEAEG